MEAARRIAGYTLGGADILRRAMGKKKPEEMAKQREIFVKGAKEVNKIETKKANDIFNILEKFAGYGFNKSHSAAYGIISYQTAYLKANFPVDFMAGVLACELGNSEKLSHFLGECQEMGIKVLGPDVNESGESFTPLESDSEPSEAIRFGLSAVKGVGDVAGKSIVEERSKNGPFQDFGDFVERVDGKAANKRVLECLIKTGAFDAMSGNRAALLADLDRAMGEAQLRRKDREVGQSNLFEMLEGSEVETSSDFGVESKIEVPEIGDLEKLKFEKELLGFFLSGHPVDTLGGLGEEFDSSSYEEIMETPDRARFRICGVLSDIERRYTKKDGSPWARFNFLAKNKDYSLPMFTEAFEQYGNLLHDGSLMVAEGIASNKDGEIRLNVTALFTIDQALSQKVDEITWLIDPSSETASDFVKQLFLDSERGLGHTKIGLAFAGSMESSGLVVDIDQRFRISISADQFKKMRSIGCVQGVRAKISDLEPVPEPKYRKRSF